MGWGQFSQNVKAGQQENLIEVRYGKLHLKQLTLDAAPRTKPGNAIVTLDGQNVAVDVETVGKSSVIKFADGIDIAAGQKLQIKSA